MNAFPLPRLGKSRAFGVLAIALGVLACGPSSGPVPPPATAANVRAAREKWPDATEEQLNSGRTIFEMKCNVCHNYPSIHAVPNERWPETIKKMQPRAALDDHQAADVLRFVIAAQATQM